MKAINRIPIKLTGKPANAKSKNSKVLCSYSSLNSEIIMLGGVPILVFMPPKIDAKARGIRNFEGFHSIFCAIPMVIGKSIAIAPMLFIKEERSAAININIKRNCISPVTLCLSKSPIT